MESAAFANGSYQLLNSVWFEPCGINIPEEYLTPDTIGNLIPSGMSTFIYSHYWQTGEPQIGCIDEMKIEMLIKFDELGELDDFLQIARYTIPNYANEMSDDDLEFMSFLFEHTEITNFIVIDNENIMIATPETNNQEPVAEPRCGY